MSDDDLSDRLREVADEAEWMNLSTEGRRTIVEAADRLEAAERYCDMWQQHPILLGLRLKPGLNGPDAAKAWRKWKALRDDGGDNDA